MPSGATPSKRCVILGVATSDDGDAAMLMRGAVLVMSDGWSNVGRCHASYGIQKRRCSGVVSGD